MLGSVWNAGGLPLDVESFDDERPDEVGPAVERQPDGESERERGDDGEYDPDVESIAAPIIDATGYPRGSIAVISGADQLLEGDREADASLLVSASKSVENVLTD